ncbi:MAG: hypothetical protein HYT71_01325 [Candidatus Aenigmarchaeota archaeon]|nr:hypothetical protein [Candidatus Aenigmarchaeota archaeon]
MVTPKSAADKYEQIDRLTRTGVSVLGKQMSPTAAITSAGDSYTQANTLFGGLTAPKRGKDQVAGLKDAIVGYARTAMRTRVEDVYKKMGDASYTIDRRGSELRGSGILSFKPGAGPFKALAIGRPSPEKALRSVGDAQTYATESKGYVKDVFSAFNATGLTETGDREFKKDLEKRLADAEKKIGEKKADLWGAERRKSIRRGY